MSEVRDVLGNTLSPQASVARAAIDDFILGLLGYERRVTHILAAADSNDDCLSNAYAALVWLLAETGDVPDEARRYILRAQTFAAAASARERDVLEVAQQWADGDVAAAERIAQNILTAHPRDLVMLKLLHYHQFNRGDFPAMLRAALGAANGAADIPYLHGMLAFAYEQCHRIGEAETSARRALAMQPGEPWAQHALAHALLTTGRIAEGIAFLESANAGWTDLISFMYTHLWWHLALFYISRGRDAEALAIYDDHCWSQEREVSQDQIGAVSLLTRLELAGIDIGGRWNDLGTYLAARAGDVMQPFLSLQYLYGLARARRPEAQRLLDAIRRAPLAGPVVSRVVWAEVGVGVAEGLVAHAAGDYETALVWLEPALERLIEVGGSHVQRDLFHQIVLDALVRSGRLSQARQVLESRRAADLEDVFVIRLLSDVDERAREDPALRADHRPAEKAPRSS
jgi:hypothetical protein